MRQPPSPDQPLRETEQAAWHAFREWPLLLVLRHKELQAQPKSPAPASEKVKGVPPNGT